jgi:hypothetical protein
LGGWWCKPGNTHNSLLGFYYNAYSNNFPNNAVQNPPLSPNLLPEVPNQPYLWVSVKFLQGDLRREKGRSKIRDKQTKEGQDGMEGDGGAVAENERGSDRGDEGLAAGTSESDVEGDRNEAG